MLQHRAFTRRENCCSRPIYIYHINYQYLYSDGCVYLPPLQVSFSHVQDCLWNIFNFLFLKFAQDLSSSRYTYACEIDTEIMNWNTFGRVNLNLSMFVGSFQIQYIYLLSIFYLRLERHGRRAVGSNS